MVLLHWLLLKKVKSRKRAKGLGKEGTSMLEGAPAEKRGHGHANHHGQAVLGL